MHDLTGEIHGAVRQLKSERDTWQAVALQYKTAFEAQSSRLQKLQDICFATQAELENERAQQCRQQDLSSRSDRPSTINSADNLKSAQGFGMAVLFPTEKHRRASDACTNPLFDHVQQCIDQRNYGTAQAEVERLLRGPLSSKARAEGLLLKSTILRAAGPDELYDALAACSEALELCDRIADLEAFLPKIQFQRGVLYYELRMLNHARDAFSAISCDDPLFATATEYHKSCDDGITMQRNGNRRSGFDENRTFDEGLVVELDEKIEKRRRRLSTQLRIRVAVGKSKRTSLPHRWMSSKSDPI